MKLLCPTCKKNIEYDLNNSFRPFCCEKCRLIDLGAWASEEYKISGNENKGESNEEI
ncbi:DNA gyrase inhibitor YacG [Methylophilaceae bacterium]|nr:DNA gyrase inhibitor YacG [Methylophilaceae bacterium]MDC1173046.1 DNA gyrase inhibitor YacG [Methylophilaceae bacterium]